MRLDRDPQKSDRSLAGHGFDFASATLIFEGPTLERLDTWEDYGEARPAQAAGFEWDAGNATKSWAKHVGSQAECEQVLFNAPLVLAGDPAHSADEDRFFTLGHTDGERLLLVVFTLRGPLVRVISARPMSRGEREVHRDAQAPEDAG